MTTGKTTKTGLFFGSFDPIHTGHLIIAQYFIEFSDLDQVWFVITPQNPFKVNHNLLPDKQRLELAELAIDNNPKFSVCDVELKLDTPSYTINTLRKIQEIYPGQTFVMIMGSDNLGSFNHWKDYKEILKGFKIYVYPRAEHPSNPLKNRPEIHVFEAPYLEISSSNIRDMIANKRRPRYLLPERVLQKIEDAGYYR